MSESETTEVVELAVGVSLLAGGIVMMYYARDVYWYYASTLSAGIGGFGALAGGGDLETSREIAAAVVSSEPTTVEYVLFFAGCVSILFTRVERRTGFLSSRISGIIS